MVLFQICAIVMMVVLALLQTVLIVAKLLGHSVLNWYQTLTPLGVPLILVVGTTLAYVLLAWAWWLFLTVLPNKDKDLNHD